ncbi:MAG TPA: acyl-CoA dehydrogenase family protein [Solirubrobacteraceae bacterium]|jgi:alkylation response protein AidB-like acyl-CoA dehydrogenase|nr:acyl-CoA dehydrogenase family protein [Solirubrobacteraceae bacterium]
MNFSLTDEQLMLRDAAVNALGRIDTVAGARAALDGQSLPDIWPTACEAGWTGLLVPESHGGAGLTPFDAMLVLEQCGRRLTGAGLIGHLAATYILAEDDHPLLAALATGEQRAAVVWDEEFQLDVAQADWLVTGDGVVEAGRVTVDPITRFDASRPLGHVRGAGPVIAERAWHVTQALLAADALGVTEAMLEMSVAYAKERHAFGRPIGSYQAIKQQIVEILRHAGTTRSLIFYAGYAADARPGELPLAASAARFAGEEAAEYATRTCIAVHGGIGATWEHDAHLYWRRAQLSRLLLGGVGGAGDRVAEAIIQRAREMETV